MAGRGPKPEPPLLAIGGPAMSYGRVTPAPACEPAPSARSHALPADTSVD